MSDEDLEKEIGIRGERTCPRCGVHLIVVERGGERLDVCEKCGGIWFDHFELDEVMGDGSPVELLITIKETLKSDSLPCPQCRSNMKEKEVYGVNVDQCESCNGVWLDAGETEKIWAETERTKNPRHYEDNVVPPYDFWYHFKKKFGDLKNY